MGDYRNILIRGDYLEGEERCAGGWVRFSALVPLKKIHFACYNGPAFVASAIWKQQDGYGDPGHTPPQGWDWSGIRDSTLAAITEMEVIADRWYRGQFGPDALWPWERAEARRAL